MGPVLPIISTYEKLEIMAMSTLIFETPKFQGLNLVDSFLLNLAFQHTVQRILLQHWAWSSEMCEGNTMG